MPIALISHPDCALHNVGNWHPERPARLHAIADALIASGLDALMPHHEAPQATREQLTRVHDPAYVEHVFQSAPTDGVVWLDPDTGMMRHTLGAALRAAGAGVLAVDGLMDGRFDAAFCNVRPPGHHAERDRAMGFCLFNNVAVAAAHALEHHGLEHVAIADFDVHHGNGTEDIFRDDDRVLVCSTFQHPFYPHSGADTRHEHIVNAPLPAGSDGAAFRRAVDKQWLPALEQHRPQLVLFSAGFDAHAADDMAGLNLCADDYAWVTEQVYAVAKRHAAGRVASLLEGGYELEALADSVVAHVKALL